MVDGPADRPLGAENAPRSFSRALLPRRGWIPALAGACVLGGLVVLLVLSLGSSPRKSSPPPPAGPSLATAASPLGTILVNGRGLTLYMFTHDGPSRSSCSGSCARVWPPATVSGRPTLGRGIARRRVTTLRRADGSTQLVYDGHPLYRFSEDLRAGQQGGEGFLHAWFVVSPSGRRMAKPGEPAPSSSY